MTQTRRDAGKGRILAGTPGHQRVAVFGVFDGIHAGHQDFDGIHAGHQDFLRQAREYGDELVVIVARDKSVTQLKGKPPIHPEEIGVAIPGAVGKPGNSGRRGAIELPSFG